jgi:long-chain fatty acid transport protein
LLRFDVTWINWRETMKDFGVNLTNGDNANVNRLIGKDSIDGKLPLEWDDQVVIAAGVQYEFIKQLWGRVGCNYGKNPVPEATVFPVFPAIVERHITAGLGYQYKFFAVNAAYEYAVPNAEKASADHKIASESDKSESTLGEHTAHLMTSFAF